MPPCQRRMVTGYVADFILPSVPGNAGANSDWEHLQDLEASLQGSSQEFQPTNNALVAGF